MSIPLVQKAEKDDINTSIIAIKRNIERINMLLGLVDSGGSDPDLSGLATKQELQDAVESLQPVDEVTIDNMQSVTSNAVSKALGYSTSEYFTGKYWVDGKKIYGRVFTSENGDYPTNYVTICSQSWCQTIERIIGGVMILPTIGLCVNDGRYYKNGNVIQLNLGYIFTAGNNYIALEYTKTTD